MQAYSLALQNINRNVNMFPYSLFMFCSFKKSSSCGPCSVVGWLVCLLLFLTSLAALMGVYKAHFLSSGAVFGTTSGSLAILAFSVTVVFWMKCMVCCCGCGKGK